MEEAHCEVCSSGRNEILFKKNSRGGEPFTLVRCRDCGLRYVSPRPDENEIAAYYTADYFTRRDDRGYDDYFSAAQQQEFNRITELNLRDLGFYRFEQSLGENAKRSLDIGCAAGYFVEYLDARGWDARGIDISGESVRFGQDRGLQVENGNYLHREYRETFNLVTLWATVEHLHHPGRFISKIRSELDSSGRLYISTCRVGGCSWMRAAGKDWRFYNFPEHLVFFSIQNMKRLLEQNGFRADTVATYGSGMGAPGSLVRKGADFMAKHFLMGDMMLIGASRG